MIASAEVPDAVDGAYRAITALVDGLDERAFSAPSRCDRWSVRDVLFHQLLDAQRALVALATPADGEPDVDHVEYWRPFKPGMAGSAEQAAFVRTCAAAYSSASVLAEQWNETAAAAVRALRSAEPSLRVLTQGHRMSVDDFCATLAVEATIHHLDMALRHPRAESDPAALRVTTATLDGLLGAPRPAWDDVDYVLKGTGRIALDDGDRTALGALADRFPLLG